MNDLMKFDFNGRAITTITDESGEPWFVAKEVCEVLGLTNVSLTLVSLDPEDKQDICGVKVGRDINKLRIINESGLYDLIFKSRKPQAKAFKKWVTSVVLPAIRKTGGYIHGADKMSDAEIMARAVLIGQKTIEEQARKIEEMSPKAQVFDALISTETTFSFTDAAKKLGVGPRKLIGALHDRGVLYGPRHTPKAYFMDRGYFEVKTVVIEKYQTTVSQTRVTPRGLAWLSKNTWLSRLIEENTRR